MAGGDIVFTNARVVLPGECVTGSVAARGGRIADVAAGPSAVAGVDFGGDLLIPGLVELHTDHLERELRPRRGVDWPAHSALSSHDAKLAACGITTVFDAVVAGDTFGRPERAAMLETSVRVIEEAKAGRHLRADHYIHVRCEVGNSDLLPLFDRFGLGPLVRMVSVMDHTPGARQYADIDRFRAYLRTEYKVSEADTETYIRERQALSEKHAPENRRAVAARIRARGIKLATHDDADAAQIADAVALGAAVSEFPTTHEAAKAAYVAGLMTVLGAPNIVRGGSHNGNVSAADLAAEGLLDALSSDYMPFSLIEAPFALARTHGIALPDTIALVTANPARMAGFADRGTIAAGLRADLVRVRETPNGVIVRGVWREGERIA